jgi:hypothetical protein
VDLIVLAVHQHEGRMHWLERSVGGPIARGAGQMTLFTPHGVEGFVSRHDGSISLRNILIPVTSRLRPQPSVEAAARLIRNLHLPAGIVTLLHVGPTAEAPLGEGPKRHRLDLEPRSQTRRASWHNPRNRYGSSRRSDCDDDRWSNGFLDGLRGTTSERVLRKACCPVANLPVGSMLG